MTGLVLEGGTFRGTFSAGFMDALIEENIEFPYIVGVSAGISNAASYVSKQFGLDFVYDEIPNKLVPFDYEEYHKYKGRFLVGVTNAETGKFECFDSIRDTDKWQYLRASCAIPGYFPPIMINGKPYFDGGLASPICVKQALKDGCSKTVIILTQPKGFVKKCGKGNIVMSQLIKSKYPAMEMPLLARHKLYNNQIQFCEELERRGKALIFRPSEALDSFQKNTSELERYWKMGYDLAKANADRIRDFMN